MLVFAFIFIRKEHAAVALWSIKQFKELLVLGLDARPVQVSRDTTGWIRQKESNMNYRAIASTNQMEN